LFIIIKEISYLGTVDASPRDYISKYGSTLKKSHELPAFVGELERPPHEPDQSNQLIGDVEAFKLLDVATLEREGLSQYRHLIGRSSPAVVSSHFNGSSGYGVGGSSANYY